MKQQPAIYGIGWVDEADVTFAYIATHDEVGAVLAGVLGHAGGSGSYPLHRDGLDRVIAAADAGAAVDILGDLADDGSDVLVVFAARTARTAGAAGAVGSGARDPHVALLRDTQTVDGTRSFTARRTGGRRTSRRRTRFR